MSKEMQHNEVRSGRSMQEGKENKEREEPFGGGRHVSRNERVKGGGN